MGFHTFDPSETDRLEDTARFRYCSREELLQHLPTGEETRLLDIGSGTGFYTDELAPFVGEIVALDVQTAMHHQYRRRGMPENVAPVTADAQSLPFDDDTFDAAVSTMTFHESASPASCAELSRVLAADGITIIVDWSAAGRGESGPPRTERYDAADAREMLDAAGFDVVIAVERSETLAVVCVRSGPT